MTEMRPWYDTVDWQSDPKLAYLRGLQDGVQIGRDEADQEVVRVMAEALGGPGCTDRAEAVQRHLRAVDAKARRAYVDRTGVAA